MQEKLDVRGLKCPLPILRAKKELAQLESQDTLEIWATDSGAPNDFVAFCRQTGHILLSQETVIEDGQTVFHLIIQHK